MADKQHNNNNANLNRYETDVTGVSMKTLEAGLWWAKNRRVLRITLITFLILVSIVTWGYSLYGLGSYLLVGMNADNQTIKNFMQSNLIGQNYLDQGLSKNLTLSSVGYLANDSKYDLYLQATNPNARWWTTFDYCFSRPNGEKSCGSDFILPGENKYILSLGQTFSADPGDINFSYNNVSWNKINNHVIADRTNYRAEHLNVAVKNQLFTPAESNAASEKISLNSLTFTLINNSAYSYWEMPMSIILTNGRRIVYINHYTISDFISYESRDVKITWPGTVSGVTNINITPDVNILDQGVYQQPK
jgi:hypothetical protein